VPVSEVLLTLSDEPHPIFLCKYANLSSVAIMGIVHTGRRV
jgi:hypothetical protein